MPKGGSATDPRGKLPAYGPGTPVYPPERLPPQARGGSTAQATPTAAASSPGTPAPAGAAAQASTAPAPAAGAPASPSADPRGELPANNPFSLTQRPTVTAAAGRPAPAPAVRARPKAAGPAQPPAAMAPPTQPALLMAPATPESAPTAAPADSSAAEPAPAEVSRGAPAALAPFSTDPPPSLSSRPAARGAAFQAAASPDEDAQGVIPMTAAVTEPAGLPFSDPGRATAPKVAIATDAQTDEAASHSLDTSGNTADNAPDPTVAGFDFSAAHVLAAPAAAAPPPVQIPVGASGWTEEVGTHVIWMAHQGVSSASLRLQPEHLGPLEVRISLHDSTASVWFGANEPETRTALQAALPQLKEMFAAQGMTLTDAGVSREPPRDTQLPRAAPHGSAAPAAAVLDSPAALPGARLGLVDTYA